MRFCPYAQRAIFAAAAKGIKYDVVNINLTHKPEFIFEKNPEGKVPTIETDDGVVLYESLIVSDYIDEAYSTSSNLHPQSPYQKAMDRLWMQKFTKIDGLDGQLYFNLTLTSEEISARVKQLYVELKVFEDELKRRGTKFFAGTTRPGMLDLMIWPWMERLPCLELIHPEQKSLLKSGRDSLPRLGQWEKDMIGDDAVKESYLSPQIHAQYRKMRRSGGKVDYDFLNH
jgi:glutathione S-transferase